MFVDLLRWCYTTRMRFFRDDPLEIPVKWFFCDPAAKKLPTYTIFASGNWASDGLPWPGLGEVLDAPRAWSNGRTPPGLIGQKFCGTTGAFIRGVSAPQHVEVNREFVPLCCLPPPGVVLGGDAEFAVLHGQPVSTCSGVFFPPGFLVSTNGAMLDGSAEITAARRLVSVGGALIDGSATITKMHSQLSTGGLRMNGAAQFQHEMNLRSIGGAVLAGSANITAARRLVSAGGAAIDGSATIQRRFVLESQGGAVLDGAARMTRSRLLISDGGAVLDGSAGISAARRLVSRGGVVLDGSAGISSSRRLVSRGPILLDGSAGISAARRLVSRGGVVLDGSAALTAARRLVSRGGVVLDGSGYTGSAPCLHGFAFRLTAVADAVCLSCDTDLNKWWFLCFVSEELWHSQSFFLCGVVCYWVLNGAGELQLLVFETSAVVASYKCFGWDRTIPQYFDLEAFPVPSAACVWQTPILLSPF